MTDKKKGQEDQGQLDLLEPAEGEEFIEFDADTFGDTSDNEGADENETEDGESESRKPSRAEKRIRSLAAEKKKLEEELNEIKSKMKESEKTTKQTVSGLQVSKAESDYSAAVDKVAAAKKEVRDAASSGDDDAVASAYENLATAVNLRTVAQQWLEYVKSTGDDAPDETNEEPKSPPQKGPRELTDLEKAFTRGNAGWFKKDPVMTMTIQGVHQALVEQGYNPDDMDDDDGGHVGYWEEVDRQMSEIFGDKYKKVTTKGKKSPAVTPPSGAPNVGRSKGGKTQVRLTPDQLEMAKRLGIPPKRYAEELAKKQQRTA